MLSAVEGLKLVTTQLEPYVLPLTIIIIIALFAVQSRGTSAVATFFGPITLAWFAALAIGGLLHIADNPAVLTALNPLVAGSFLISNGVLGFVVVGAVFLAVTGAEALYADLGHFGRGPIQVAWSVVAFPALALNYFGQGALVWQIQLPRPIRFFCSIHNGRFCRWCSWQRLRPLSQVKPSSPVPTH